MWPPVFKEFSLRDRGMPLLYATDGTTAAAIREGDVERGIEHRVSSQGGEAFQVAENKKRDGESAVRGSANREARSVLSVSLAHASPSIPFTASASGSSIQHTSGIQPTEEDIHYSSKGITSFVSSTTTLMDSHGHIATTGLPPKRFDQFIRTMRYTVFSVYRRLHILVLLPNILAMVIIGALNSPGLLKTPVTSLATAATANILLGVLMRQEIG